MSRKSGKLILAMALSMTSAACKTQYSGAQLADAGSSGSGKGLSAEEAQLVQLYGVQDLYDHLRDKEKQEIMERFLVAALSIHKVIGGTLAKVGSADMQSQNLALIQAFQKYRSEFFRIEGLIRIYKSINKYKDFMHPLYTNVEKSGGIRPNFGVKEMEDRVGKFAELCGNLEFVTGVDTNQQALAKMQEKCESARKEVLQLLSIDWRPRQDGKIPYFVRLFGALAENRKDLYDNKEDNHKVAKALIEEIEGFQAKKLDYSDLEEGFHELRRNLRWLPLYIICFDGLILPDRNNAYSNIPEYDATLKNDDLKSGKYIAALDQFHRPKGYKKFPYSLFSAAVYYAEGIGGVKDVWQKYEAIIEVRKELGMSETEARSQADQIFVAKGIQRVPYSAASSFDMMKGKGMVLFDFAPMGQDIGRVVKDSQRGIFAQYIKYLK